MAKKRQERKGSVRHRRARIMTAAAAAAFVLAVALTGWFVSTMGNGAIAEEPRAATPAATSDANSERNVTSFRASAEATAEVAPMVEVPSVLGKTIAEAKTVLGAAGLGITIEEDEAAAGTVTGDERTVVAQEPQPGAMAASGSGIVLRVPAVQAAADVEGSTYVVCIDPGHQSRSDSTKEPIGPGASETKERIRGGTSGIVTRIPEYEVTLQIAMNLKDRLETAGIRVVMTRETNDVNVSNAERAQIANEADADLFVRVHCDGNPDQSVHGVSTLYPGSNQWTSSFAVESKRAATLVQDATVAATGAESRGIVERNDITGFNWAGMPSVLVECGFMSNPVEDKLLTSPHYQDKLAEGMTVGILEYLGR